MSRRSLGALGAVAVVMAVFLHVSAPGEARAPDAGLPGARPAVQASQYPTLQAALDALPPEGGLLMLPAGHFQIDQPLIVTTPDVCIAGHGTATHIENTNQDGLPAMIIHHPAAGESRQNRLWRVRLTNFRVTGNPQSGHGVVCKQINEVYIDGLSVSYHGGDGILLDYCYEDPRVCNSLITYNKGTGLNLQGCHDIVVSANQFEENQDALHCFDGFNLCMTGNCLDDHLGDGVRIENTYGSVVSGNMIEECQGAAMILDRDCYGITLSANVVAHNGAGILLRDAHGCAVSANTLTLMKRDAVYLGPRSGRIAVSGNSFCSSYVGGGMDRRRPDDRAAAGLVLEDTVDVNVSSNTFSGVGPRAVDLRKSSPKRVLFTNNLLTDAEGDHKQLSRDSIVSDNLEQ